MTDMHDVLFLFPLEDVMRGRAADIEYCLKKKGECIAYEIYDAPMNAQARQSCRPCRQSLAALIQSRYTHSGEGRIKVSERAVFNAKKCWKGVE